MARIRTIKPEFWTDKKVAAWPLFTRLLFIGLWSAADDHGRGSAESARLAAELFPYDLSRDSRETLARVSEGLARLSEDHRITLYEVDGEVFYQVENWAKHQRVDKPGKSRIPTPCDKFATLSRDSRECLATLSRLEQGTGNREQGTDSLSSGSSNADKNEIDSDSEDDSEDEIEDKTKPPVEYTQDFLAFYDAYPKRQGKRSAAKAFALAKRRKPPPEIIQAAKDYAAAIVWQEPRFIPHPATWLNQDRFDDDRIEWMEPAARDAARLKARLDAWEREGE